MSTDSATAPACDAPRVARRSAAATPISRRSAATGVLAGFAMAAFYVAMVSGASGSWMHLRAQARQDWPYPGIIITGFTVQVALITELRRRHRLDAADTAAGGLGAGASTGGMVACCAHHLADLLPFVGATGAATFLIAYRIPFMVVGIGVNAVGVFLASRQLQRLNALLSQRGERKDAQMAGGRP